MFLVQNIQVSTPCTSLCIKTELVFLFILFAGPRLHSDGSWHTEGEIKARPGGKVEPGGGQNLIFSHQNEPFEETICMHIVL